MKHYKYTYELLAWATGAPIQRRYVGSEPKGKWMCADIPNWRCPHNYEFRIHPDYKLRYTLQTLEHLTDEELITKLYIEGNTEIANRLSILLDKDENPK